MSKTFLEALTSVGKNLQSGVDELKETIAVDGTYVTPEQYGAKGDGTTDDSAAFLAAIATGKNILCKSNATYYFSNKINARAYHHSFTLDGNNAQFKNFCLEYNMESDTYTWRAKYRSDIVTLQNIKFGAGYYDLDVDPFLPCVISGSPCAFYNCRMSGRFVLLAYTDSYIDYLRVDSVLYWFGGTVPDSVVNYKAIMSIASDGTLQEHGTNTAGDGWVFVGTNAFMTEKVGENGEKYGLVTTYGNNGVSFTNCICNYVKVDSLSLAIFNACHFESSNCGVKIVESSHYNSANFSSCYFWGDADYPLNGDKTIYNNCFFRIGTDDTIGSFTKKVSLLKNAILHNCELSGYKVDSSDYNVPLTNNYLNLSDYTTFTVEKVEDSGYTHGFSYETVTVTGYMRMLDNDSYYYKTVSDSLDITGGYVKFHVSNGLPAIYDFYITRTSEILHGRVIVNEPSTNFDVVLDTQSYHTLNFSPRTNYPNVKYNKADTLEVITEIPSSEENTTLFNVGNGFFTDTAETLKIIKKYMYISPTSINKGSGY